jgi:hypothetical protein
MPFSRFHFSGKIVFLTLEIMSFQFTNKDGRTRCHSHSIYLCKGNDIVYLYTTSGDNVDDASP